MTFYSEPGIVTATKDLRLNALIVSWENLSSSEHIRACCEAQIRQVQRGAAYLILDVSNASGVVPQDDQKWFGETLFPSFDKAGLKGMINLLPSNAITKLSSRGWMRTASPFGFEMFETDDMGKAKTLIKELAAR